jgi:hypothetical protein
MLLQSFDQPQNVPGLVTQIGVNGGHELAARRREAGAQRLAPPSVGSVRCHPDVLIGLGDRSGHRFGLVGAPVVDQDDFPRVPRFGQAGVERAHQIGYVLGLIVHRHNHRYADRIA